MSPCRLTHRVYDFSRMDARRISSRQHPLVRRCRDAAGRRLDGTVLLDGEHLVTEALDVGLPVEAVLTDGRPRPLLSRLAARGVAHYIAGEGVLAAASPVRTPSGVVALASWTPGPLSAVVSGREALVIGMVGVQDPGNVGGIIRSAYALGATGVLALDGTADPSGWKVLRGAMGSTFRLQVACGTVGELVALAGTGRIPLVAAVAHGGSPPDQLPLTRPMVLLLGSEGQGLPPALVDHAVRQVHVPLERGAESLNVGATAAILLWEIRRRAVSRPGRTTSL